MVGSDQVWEKGLYSVQVIYMQTLVRSRHWLRSDERVQTGEPAWG